MKLINIISEIKQISYKINVKRFLDVVHGNIYKFKIKGKVYSFYEWEKDFNVYFNTFRQEERLKILKDFLNEKQIPFTLLGPGEHNYSGDFYIIKIPKIYINILNP
jgi:hypothetical protein